MLPLFAPSEMRTGILALSRLSNVSSNISLSSWNMTRHTVAAPQRSLIYTSLKEVKDTDQEFHGSREQWVSRRLLLRRHGLGFGFHDTIIKKGAKTLIWYTNHVEACYVVQGRGEVEILLPDEEEGQGEFQPIYPGMVFVLDNQDRIVIHAHTKIRMLCVFDPPLAGKEDHCEEGIYSYIAEKPRSFLRRLWLGSSDYDVLHEGEEQEEKMSPTSPILSKSPTSPTSTSTVEPTPSQSESTGSEKTQPNMQQK